MKAKQLTIDVLNVTCLILVLAGFLLSITTWARASETEGSAPAAALTRINVSFKLDPRLSGPTYGGERWVSPATYMGASAQDAVEVRARTVDARGAPARSD